MEETRFEEEPVALFHLLPTCRLTTPMMPVPLKFWDHIAREVTHTADDEKNPLIRWEDLFKLPRQLHPRAGLRLVTLTSPNSRNYITSLREQQVDPYITYDRLATIDPGRRSPYMTL